MGKKTLFVICLLLFVLIAGCNSTKTTDEPSANSQEKVSEKRQKKKKLMKRTDKMTVIKMMKQENYLIT
ncbi:hypothetical protein BsIDN1_54330 [Bacillus safensis]|uniref:Lipoprotein n=1 Tax=Bacillus safensis TaxID=561879 RepID=A0A5S9MGC0_BACIA|nr:hypothetical protein BsIDN1_54330 [Bacillus safensis]